MNYEEAKSVLNDQAMTGWYVQRNAQVWGPIDFRTVAELDKPEEYLVTRRGLSHWYPLRDFGRFLDNLIEEDQPQTQRFESNVSQGRFDSRTTDFSTRQVVKSRTVGIGQLRAKPVEPEAAAPQPTTAVPSEEKGSTASVSDRPYIASPHPVLVSELIARMHEMRVGEIRRFGILDFFGFFWTIGFSWIRWFKRVDTEVTEHGKIGRSNARWRVLLAIIPGLHILAATILAKRVRRMELQNNYAATSVPLVTLLSFAPPICMWYLQRKLNRHWEAHANFEWKQILAL